MNQKMMAIVALSIVGFLVVIAILIGFAVPLGGLGGSGGELQLVDYSVSSGDISPTLNLTFSRNLDTVNTIEILNSDYKCVGTWVYQGGSLGKTARITNINPPNLIGTYYVVVKWKENVVLNKSIYFKEPALNIVRYHLNLDQKGDLSYLESVNITLSESGDSPYYYNRIRWSLDGNERGEKIPMEHFNLKGDKVVKVNTATYLNSGEHTLVVHFDYFDFYTVTVVVHFTV